MCPTVSLVLCFYIFFFFLFIFHFFLDAVIEHKGTRSLSTEARARIAAKYALYIFVIDFDCDAKLICLEMNFPPTCSIAKTLL